MGQVSSQEIDRFETRVEDPEDGQRPVGLALIAHGRLGGTFDQPPVRRLAEYLCKTQHLRVVTWNARGMGNSSGGNEWTGFRLWIGDGGILDYNHMLRDAMSKFVEDFPEIQQPRLFICGYSAGAIFAGCTRPPPNNPRFSPVKYILISYPVELNPLIAVYKSGSYFRSVEALVQGHGWENLPPEYGGIEPDVAGVLTVSGQYEKAVFYGRWTRALSSKDARNILTQVAVDGAGHAWGDKSYRIVEEVDKWLRTGAE